jgi:hypothetical protein
MLYRQAAIIGVAVALGLPSALAAQSPTALDLTHSNAAGS